MKEREVVLQQVLLPLQILLELLEATVEPLLVHSLGAEPWEPSRYINDDPDTLCGFALALLCFL